VLNTSGETNKLPIIRKVIPIGKTSKAVIIPKSWLQFFEQESGQPIENVAIEVNRILKITPILQRRKEIPEASEK
jgi:antitoxin component of MazEF toxin-antitoxin module